MKIRPEPTTTWISEWEAVSNDPYVATKIHRKRRISEIMDFITSYIPELKGPDSDVDLEDGEIVDDTTEGKAKKVVVDIGPGFMEFLEIARVYGNEIRGIDSPYDENGMGSKYQRASMLMAQRQQVPVAYDGFNNWVSNGFPYADNSIFIYNSIGSMDFVLRDFTIGTPGVEFENDSKKLSYVFDTKFEDFLVKMFKEVERTLIPNGVFMIYFNPSGNQKEFAEYLMKLIPNKVPGMQLVNSDMLRIFKFVKAV